MSESYMSDFLNKLVDDKNIIDYNQLKNALNQEKYHDVMFKIKWSWINQLNDEDLKQFFSAFSDKQTRLQLFSSSIDAPLTGEQYARVISATPEHIKTLYLHFNFIENNKPIAQAGKELALAFGKIPNSVTSVNIDLNGNKLGELSHKQLLSITANFPDNIYKLDLSHNNLGNAKDNLSPLSILENLKILDLRSNNLGSIKDSASLCQLFKNIPTNLEYLDLSSNNLSKFNNSQLTEAFKFILVKDKLIVNLSGNAFDKKNEEELAEIFSGFPANVSEVYFDGKTYNLPLPMKKVEKIQPEKEAPEEKKSCLDENDISKIQQLIKTQNRERNSFWALNRDRKETKTHALKMLLKDSYNTGDLSALLLKVEQKYPDALKGILSNRTNKFFTDLKNKIKLEEQSIKHDKK